MKSRVSPQATELEEAVLGACMLDKDAFSILTQVITAGDAWYLEKHRHIFKAMMKLHTDREPIDLLTVMEQLKRTKKLDSIGGPAYLSELTNRVASAANLEFHARIIQQKYIGRKLIDICMDVMKQAYSETDDPLELLDQLHKTIYTISKDMASNRVEKLADFLPQMKGDFTTLRLRNEGLVGVPSGLASLDRITGGWQNTDLIVIAARPGMGKTAFVLSQARFMCQMFNKKVLFFSLEMSKVQLANRIISQETGISSRRFRDPKELSPLDAEKYLNTCDGIMEYNLFIDETPGIGIFELRNKARKLKEKEGIDIIMVDYLQLMSGPKGKGKNREQEISEISRNLKGLAKELNVPIIALSQLSRAVEQRGGTKRPQLSDLRESGAIEQDSDVVAFIYRPEYYDIMADDSGHSTKGLAEVIIQKHRNGPLTKVRLKFTDYTTQFDDLNDMPQFAEEIQDEEHDKPAIDDAPF